MMPRAVNYSRRSRCPDRLIRRRSRLATRFTSARVRPSTAAAVESTRWHSLERPRRHLLRTDGADRCDDRHDHHQGETFGRPCQVYVLGTSNGCIVGRDYQGIETLSRPDFPLRLFNLTTPVLRFPGESRVLVPAAMEGTGETDFPRGARGIRT